MRNILKVVFGRVLFTVLCLIIQLIWIIALVWKLNQYYVWFATVIEIIGVIVVLRINAKSEFSAARLVWTIVILSLPLFGITLYLMFGRTGLTKRTKAYYEKVAAKYSPELTQEKEILLSLKKENIYIHNQEYYIQNSSGYPVYRNTDVTYYPQTEPALEAMLKDLENAREFIFMEYFAVEDTEVFHRIEEILLKKVSEGVEVRFIYDDFGSIGFVKPEFMRRMNRQGIQCRIFNPLIPLLYVFMNHRDHRKITVIDNHVSFSGGYNLADEYFNVTHPYGHWKDTGIRLEGDAVKSLTVMFLEMWNAVKKTDQDYQKYLPETDYQAKQDGFIQPYADSPLDDEHVGESVYMNLIAHAKKEIYFTTPYLIITDEMNRALGLAAKRGVDVRIVTPGIPDKKLIYKVTRSYYAGLVRQGVRIYEYTPGFIHAKQCVCDGEAATCGTINMDYRSLYLHFENGAFLYNCDAVKEMRKDFEHIFAESTEVTEKYKSGRSAVLRGTQCLLRLFAPLM